MPSLLYILSALAAASLVHAQSVSLPCPNFHIIVARGSNESTKASSFAPANEGYIGHVVNATCSKIANCTSYGIEYPATITPFAGYMASEIKGVQAMHDAIIAFHKSCPKVPMALFGFSQGAQIVGDTLCGRSDKDFVNKTAPFTAPGWKLIIAAIQYADLAFNTTETFHIGNATTNGVFVRNNVADCQPFAPVIQSYCDAGDAWCANGPKNQTGYDIHGSYFGIYERETAAWVVNKYNAFRATTPV